MYPSMNSRAAWEDGLDYKGQVSARRWVAVRLGLL